MRQKPRRRRVQNKLGKQGCSSQEQPRSLSGCDLCSAPLRGKSDPSTLRHLHIRGFSPCISRVRLHQSRWNMVGQNVYVSNNKTFTMPTYMFINQNIAGSIKGYQRQSIQGWLLGVVCCAEKSQEDFFFVQSVFFFWVYLCLCVCCIVRWGYSRR